MRRYAHSSSRSVPWTAWRSSRLSTSWWPSIPSAPNTIIVTRAARGEKCCWPRCMRLRCMRRRVSSQPEARSGRIVVEHLHRVKRIVVQVATDERQLLQQVIGYGNHLTTDCISLEDIEQLAGTCPDQLCLGIYLEQFHRCGHEGYRIPPCIGNASRKDRYVTRHFTVQSGNYIPYLAQRHDAGHIELQLPIRQAADQWAAVLLFGVCNRDFDVHVLAPAGHFHCLTFHLREVVGKNLQRQRFIPDLRQKLLRKYAIVRNSRLAHQARIGGEPPDAGYCIHLQHAGLIRTIGKYLHVQLFDGFHLGPFPRIMRAASDKERTRKSHDAGCFSA